MNRPASFVRAIAFVLTVVSNTLRKLAGQPAPLPSWVYQKGARFLSRCGASCSVEMVDPILHRALVEGPYGNRSIFHATDFEGAWLCDTDGKPLPPVVWDASYQGSRAA